MWSYRLPKCEAIRGVTPERLSLLAHFLKFKLYNYVSAFLKNNHASTAFCPSRWSITETCIGYPKRKKPDPIQTRNRVGWGLKTNFFLKNIETCLI